MQVKKFIIVSSETLKSLIKENKISPSMKTKLQSVHSDK